MTYDVYPNTGDTPFYVEFITCAGCPTAQNWRLMRRQYLHGQEMHGWNLGDGAVNPNDNAQDMNTKPFLKFMVDGLNLMTAAQQPPSA